MSTLREFILEDFRLKLLVFCVSLMAANCAHSFRSNVKPDSGMPERILWAWERPEDLRFIDTKAIGVAFLSQTLLLRKDEVIVQTRRQPLKVDKNTFLIAVTRIESQKGVDTPTLSASQKTRIVTLLKKSYKLPNVRAVQIDFDVVTSERRFYRELIIELRSKIPESARLSITALASWCAFDRWFGDLPIDEAVPMVFQMGRDTSRIRTFLSKGNDWKEPLCISSYGLDINEPMDVEFKPNRRFFYFKKRAWIESDLQKLR